MCHFKHEWLEGEIFRYSDGTQIVLLKSLKNYYIWEKKIIIINFFNDNDLSNFLMILDTIFMLVKYLRTSLIGGSKPRI